MRNNNRNTFCTIITADYLPYAQALHYSLSKFNRDICLQILISDVHKEDLPLKEIDNHCILHFTEDVCKSGTAKEIFDKYHSEYHDEFRWSMKSVFLCYLIKAKEFEKVIYTDCDIFFFNDYNFLFKELDENNILLTPHWRSMNPEFDTGNFKILFSEGLFNAGFVAINKDGITAMDWWAKVCLFSCAKDLFEGQYDDQAFLDVLPIYFDKVKVLKHRGCNVAIWNKVECKRVVQKDGSILINNEFPIIFIHFVSRVLREWDALLNGYLDQYLDALKIFSVEVYEKEKRNRDNNPLQIETEQRFYEWGPEPKMNFAFVSSMAGSPWGGSEVLWSETSRFLSNNGFGVKVAYPKWPNRPQAVNDLIENHNIEVWEYDAHPNPRVNQTAAGNFLDKFRSKPGVDEKRQWLRNSNIDLLCISSGHATEGANWMQLAREEGIPYITIAHSCAEFLWPADWEAEHLVRLFASAVKSFFVSRGNLNLLQTQLGCTFNNAELIPNHSADLWNIEVPWPRNENETWKLACVGRLDPVAKGQDILIELLKQIHWKNRAIEVSFYGEGAQEQILKNLVKKYNLENKVKFYGQVNGLEKIWAENHALVLPSRFEGLPLVLIEAMMCKRIAIVTDVAGNAEFLDHGFTGFIAEAPTVLHFGRAMEEAWHVRDQWERMGNDAYYAIRRRVPSAPGEVLASKMIDLVKTQLPPESIEPLSKSGKSRLVSVYLSFKHRKKVFESGLFDQSYYLENNIDVLKSGMDPISHYLQFGGYEGRMPGPDFESEYYLKRYKDVAASGMNPLVHYLLYGHREGRFKREIDEKALKDAENKQYKD